MVESTVAWVSIGNKKCLKITFIGDFNKEQSAFIIEKCKKEFAGAPGNKHIVIWDCLKMTGFDNEVMLQWKGVLTEFKDSIDSVWLITTSNIIKLGASTMRLMLPFKVTTVISESEIKM